MARRGLPSKYAKMGFKRGWREYKKTKRVHTHRYVARKPVKAYSKRRKTSYSRPKTKKRGGRKTTSFGNILGSGLGGSIAAGAAVGVINKFIPINIAGADYLIAGALMKKKILTDLGGITLGRSLAGSIAGNIGGIFGGGNGGNNGGIR